MSHTQNSDVNPLELARARTGWAAFTQMTKYGVIAVVAILVLMAVFLL